MLTIRTYGRGGKYSLAVFFRNAERFLCYVLFTMDEHTPRKMYFRRRLYTACLLPQFNSSLTWTSLEKNHLWKKPFVCIFIECYRIFSSLCTERRRRLKLKVLFDGYSRSSHRHALTIMIFPYPSYMCFLEKKNCARGLKSLFPTLLCFHCS